MRAGLLVVVVAVVAVGDGRRPGGVEREPGAEPLRRLEQRAPSPAASAPSSGSLVVRIGRLQSPTT